MRSIVFGLVAILLLGVMDAGSQTVDSLFTLARKKVTEKKYEEALTFYTKIWEKDSLNFDLYMERGIVHYELQDGQKAHDDFTKAAAIKPESSEPYHRRAILFLALRYNEEAILDNTRALDLATDDTIRMISYMNRGNAKQQKRDFQGAYEDYSRGYLYDTSDVTILNNMATVLDELGRVDESLQYLRKVIQMKPDFIAGYVNLGFQFTKLKRYKEAIQYFDKALTIEKDEPLTLNNRGLARYYLKDYKGAMADINKSILVYPTNSYAFKNRALVYLALRQNDKACIDLEKAKELGFEEAYGTEVEELTKTHCKK
jgi:tetratricopeptide (TPR) repeat protein